MVRVAELLAEGQQLPGDEARREAEILLCEALGKPRSYLFAWPEAEVDAASAQRYRAGLAARGEGRPLAYLLGRREFWSLDLAVSEATLIPRRDTELLVEQALALAVPRFVMAPGDVTRPLDVGRPPYGPARDAEAEQAGVTPAAVARQVRALAGDTAIRRSDDAVCGAAELPAARVLDLGTGSGAIALALAHERPTWQVTGVDASEAALAVARANAEALGLTRVRWLSGSWFASLRGEVFDLIVSNPPYIAPDDPHLEVGDLRFEPRAALVAQDNGFAAIDAISRDAPAHLAPGGALALEHGATQGAGVRARLTQAGFEAVTSHRDLAGHERVTLGRRPDA